MCSSCSEAAASEINVRTREQCPLHPQFKVEVCLSEGSSFPLFLGIRKPGASQQVRAVRLQPLRGLFRAREER